MTYAYYQRFSSACILRFDLAVQQSVFAPTILILSLTHTHAQHSLTRLADPEGESQMFHCIWLLLWKKRKTKISFYFILQFDFYLFRPSYQNHLISKSWENTTKAPAELKVHLIIRRNWVVCHSLESLSNRHSVNSFEQSIFCSDRF